MPTSPSARHPMVCVSGTSQELERLGTSLLLVTGLRTRRNSQLRVLVRYLFLLEALQLRVSLFPLIQILVSGGLPRIKLAFAQVVPGTCPLTSTARPAQIVCSLVRTAVPL